MFQTDDKINFAIPGLYENYRINILLLDLLNQHPEYFYEKLNINAVYGNFQFCIWDGGRIFSNYVQATKDIVEKLLKIYNNSFNIPLRFVFTNPIIEENDCYDTFNNLVLETCENSMNEIVVNSPILEKYIRQNYPKYKIISSTTKCILNKDEIKKELNQDYAYCCLDYNLNKNKSFLETLSQEEKNKTEFLINAICPPNCINRKEHYKLNGLSHLNYGKDYKVKNCLIKVNNLYPNLNEKNNITIDEIMNYYVPNGFTNFKIEGRSFAELQHCLNLIKYLVKPEYQLYVIAILFEAIPFFDLNKYL